MPAGSGRLGSAVPAVTSSSAAAALRLVPVVGEAAAVAVPSVGGEGPCRNCCMALNTFRARAGVAEAFRFVALGRVSFGPQSVFSASARKTPARHLVPRCPLALSTPPAEPPTQSASSASSVLALARVLACTAAQVRFRLFEGSPHTPAARAETPPLVRFEGVPRAAALAAFRLAPKAARVHVGL